MPVPYSAASEVLGEYFRRRRRATHFICDGCGRETLAQFEAQTLVCLSCASEKQLQTSDRAS